ncbi:hypothetical protein EVAR_79816_1 [Eumeta japonica]|uniref:Uncharacterized protein n=1 Tax=Eumeta variegata TaxID=151549 RepID=A0A4C1WRX6_EUMVA|nr:hypothetical protein EVAR_79816_1 [Eumeta japonica]
METPASPHQESNLKSKAIVVINKENGKRTRFYRRLDSASAAAAADGADALLTSPLTTSIETPRTYPRRRAGDARSAGGLALGPEAAGRAGCCPRPDARRRTSHAPPRTTSTLRHRLEPANEKTRLSPRHRRRGAGGAGGARRAGAARLS